MFCFRCSGPVMLFLLGDVCLMLSGLLFAACFSFFSQNILPSYFYLVSYCYYQFKLHFLSQGIQNSEPSSTNNLRLTTLSLSLSLTLSLSLSLSFCVLFLFSFVCLYEGVCFQFLFLFLNIFSIRISTENLSWSKLYHFVGNKTKGRVSERVFQESKAR